MKNANPFLERMRQKKLRRELPRLIRTWNDPVLATVCDSITPEDDLAFVGLMTQVLAATVTGVGLAAPQIGVTKRAIVVAPFLTGGKSVSWALSPQRAAPVVMLNPVMLSHSDTTTTADEGCLSYPGVFTRVTRFDVVRVRCQLWQPGVKSLRDCLDWEGNMLAYTARIVQHELQHLDGVCLVGNVAGAARTAMRNQLSGAGDGR